MSYVIIFIDPALTAIGYGEKKVGTKTSPMDYKFEQTLMFVEFIDRAEVAYTAHKEDAKIFGEPKAAWALLYDFFGVSYSNENFVVAEIRN